MRLDDGTDLRVRSCDIVLFEVFAYGAYDVGLERLAPVRTVLDVGANVGFTSVYLAQRFPDARFVCVEPSAGSFALLKENLRRNVAEAEAINAAVVATEGSYHIEEEANPGLTTVAPGSGGPASNVEGLTIKEVLEGSGLARVDLMKLDVEGGERALLDQADDWADSIGALLAEIHPPMSVKDAAERLAHHDFKPIALPAIPLFSRMLFAVRSG